MLKKLPVQPQLEMFKTVLTSFIHPEHELCLLAKKIDWETLEDELFVEYWGESAIKEDRIKKWLEKADKLASGWKPSLVLFKGKK